MQRDVVEEDVDRGSVPVESRLAIPHPLGPRLRDLSPAELDVMQLAYNHGNLAAVLNNSAVTDLDTARAVLKLISAGCLRPE